jgi:hypothetical protein
LVLPTDGLLLVGYQATWQESNAGQARASLFIGATQAKVAAGGAAPGVQEAQISYSGGAVPPLDAPLATGTAGLTSGTPGPAGTYTGDVTTGQIMYAGGSSGGPCVVFAAAGTYDISVQFKAGAGSVTVKNRKLWAWTIGF